MINDVVLTIYIYLNAASFYTYIGAALVAVARHYMVDYNGGIVKRPNDGELLDNTKRDVLLRRAFYFCIAGLILIHLVAMNYAGTQWTNTAYVISTIGRLFIYVAPYIFMYAMTYKVCKNKCWMVTMYLTNFISIVHLYGAHLYRNF
jgi:quinol-cytochrome oxidoreductase complex cytochrome b subunit